MHYLEKDRMQNRVLGNLQRAFENNREIGSPYFWEAIEELELLKDEFDPQPSEEEEE